jgi:hypothetical protein
MRTQSPTRHALAMTDPLYLPDEPIYGAANYVPRFAATPNEPPAPTLCSPVADSVCRLRQAMRDALKRWLWKCQLHGK